MALTQEQRNTLSILGYLYYRMGRLDNAATVFAALDKLAPEGMDAISRRAAATLAAIETDRGNAEKALQLEQYRGGKEALFGFFVGQTMKAMQGKANPQVVNELLKKALG